jgi:hypothetical protein
MEKVQFIQTSPNALASLISNQVRVELQFYLAKLQKASSTEESDVVTRKETAKFFKVTTTTIGDWTKSGILHPYKVGNRVYFRRSHLMQVLEQSNPTES